MSLRPAQALVAESSTFSLRTFFESKPTEAVPEGLPTLNAAPAPMHAAPEPELAPPSPPSYGAPRPPIGAPASALAPKEGKFTFNGLMPTTTPIQLQHKLLLQHQQAALQTASAANKPSTLAPQQDANEVLRLKAQVLSLTERINQLNANLASTSESVVRGNKALTTERAQFHAKFSSLTKKLEATQAALVEAEAAPQEALSHAKLLNAKILELQEENGQLTQTRAQLETAIATKEEELKGMEETRASVLLAATGARATLEARCEDLEGKYASLAAQHSLALGRQEELGAELDECRLKLEATEADLGEANERLEATKVDVATADQLVDELDAKLASVRVATGTCGDTVREQVKGYLRQVANDEEVEPAWSDASGVHFRGTVIPHDEWDEIKREVEQEMETVPTEAVACCPKTMRCEELELAASKAREAMHGAAEDDCEALAEELRFAEAMAKRARWNLESGAAERVMVTHVYADAADALAERAACCGLEAAVRDNPLPMGRPFDASFHLARVGAAATTEAAATDRTNAFVKAVSADLKFHMDDSQALYQSSLTTGTALRM